MAGLPAPQTAINGNQNADQTRRGLLSNGSPASGNTALLQRTHVLPFGPSAQARAAQIVFQANDGRNIAAPVVLTSYIDTRLLCYCIPALQTIINAGTQTPHCTLTGPSSLLEHYRHIFTWISGIINSVLTLTGRTLPYRYSPCPTPCQLDFSGLALLRMTAQTLGMTDLEERVAERVQAKDGEVKWWEVVLLMRHVPVEDKSVVAYMEHKVGVFARDSTRRGRVKEAVAECSKVNPAFGRMFWRMVRDRRAPAVALGGSLSGHTGALLESFSFMRIGRR